MSYCSSLAAVPNITAAPVDITAIPKQTLQLREDKHGERMHSTSSKPEWNLSMGCESCWILQERKVVPYWKALGGQGYMAEQLATCSSGSICTLMYTTSQLKQHHSDDLSAGLPMADEGAVVKQAYEDGFCCEMPQNFSVPFIQVTTYMTYDSTIENLTHGKSNHQDLALGVLCCFVNPILMDRQEDEVFTQY